METPSPGGKQPTFRALMKRVLRGEALDQGKGPRKWMLAPPAPQRLARSTAAEGAAKSWMGARLAQRIARRMSKQKRMPTPADKGCHQKMARRCNRYCRPRALDEMAKTEPRWRQEVTRRKREEGAAACRVPPVRAAPERVKSL